MDKVKRRPGRPKGSETDDSVPLLMMARLLTDDPKLVAKTAARRVFKGGSWGLSSEDASIHRWQGKWKTDGEAYKARVQAERVEAERQRTERAAALARQAGARRWEEAATAPAAGAVPGWMAGSDAMCEALAKHNKVMAGLTVPAALAKIYALTGSGLSVPGTIADAKRMGVDMEAAMRITGYVQVTPAIQEALRRAGTFGVIEAHAGIIANMPKLPRGF